MMLRYALHELAAHPGRSVWLVAMFTLVAWASMVGVALLEGTIADASAGQSLSDHIDLVIGTTQTPWHPEAAVAASFAPDGAERRRSALLSDWSRTLAQYGIATTPIRREARFAPHPDGSVHATVVVLSASGDFPVEAGLTVVSDESFAPTDLHARVVPSQLSQEVWFDGSPHTLAREIETLVPGAVSPIGTDPSPSVRRAIPSIVRLRGFLTALVYVFAGALPAALLITFRESRRREEAVLTRLGYPSQALRRAAVFELLPICVAGLILATVAAALFLGSSAARGAVDAMRQGLLGLEQPMAGWVHGGAGAEDALRLYPNHVLRAAGALLLVPIAVASLINSLGDGQVARGGGA